MAEVERAIDNLSKSGKAYQGGPGPYAANTRRESFPVPGRGYSDMGSMPSARFGQDRANQMPNPRSSAMGRYPPVAEFDGGRPGSTVGMPGYGVPPRFAPAQNDQEQALQAKRRLAAQRERELRNYHQEQQYSRGPFISQADTAMTLTLLQAPLASQLTVPRARPRPTTVTTTAT